MSFKNDLENAQQVENELQQMYINSGYTATTTAHLGQFSGYDIHITSGGTLISYTLEVKHDIMSDVTGNIAIELNKKINNKIEKSGLSATNADYQVYKIRNKFYSISTADLKILLRKLKDNNALPIVSGGDGGSVQLALISKYVFKQNSKQI